MSNTPFMIDLPSRGLLYDGKLPEGKVSLRPMGDQEEALLLQMGGDPTLKMARIIDQCYLNQEDVPPDQLLLVDRFYILFMLRLEMFGPLYKIPFRCQQCAHQEETTINVLDELNKYEMGIDPDTGGEIDVEEPFDLKFPLPRSGIRLRLRFLRGSDEKQIVREMRSGRFGPQRGPAREATGSSDLRRPENVLRLARHIVAANGTELKWPDALKLVQSLDMGDRNEIRLEVQAVEGGVDLTLLLDCPTCATTNKFLMPFTVEFLQPSLRLAGRSPRTEILPALLRRWGIQWDVGGEPQSQRAAMVHSSPSKAVEGRGSSAEAGGEGGQGRTAPHEAPRR